jgi:hypothetical protein
VLQVVSANLNTQATTSSTSPTTTGLSVSITPKFATSKILIFSSATVGSSGTNLNRFSFARGTTVLNNPNGESGVYMILAYSSTVAGWGIPWSMSYLDSPATTSATAYSVYFWTDNAANIVSFNSRQSSSLVGQATITLMEIAA